MKYIPLTQGKTAIVDDEDFEWLSQYKWCFNVGYAIRNTKGQKPSMVLMHRQILNAPSGYEVDHINGDRLDNRRSNLRLASKTENRRNHPRHSHNTTQYKGVYFHKSPQRQKRYQAVLVFDGKKISGGYYLTEIAAARAYDELVKKYHGEFARLNFPQGDVTNDVPNNETCRSY